MANEFVANKRPKTWSTFCLMVTLSISSDPCCS